MVEQSVQYLYSVCIVSVILYKAFAWEKCGNGFKGNRLYPSAVHAIGLVGGCDFHKPGIEPEVRNILSDGLLAGDHYGKLHKND